MKIDVLVKHVPELTATRRFARDPTFGWCGNRVRRGLDGREVVPR